ncbi:MAG: hypothetical protein MJ198_07640 [Bacteroidales bacterium]|nr:hypothetical protein [Bacteroidales bacterium]
MKKVIVYLFGILCVISCSKNPYIDATVDKATVEFASTTLNETISFVADEEYCISVPIQIFGGLSSATLNVAVETKLPEDSYSINKSKVLTGNSLDTIQVLIKTSKLKKGTSYSIKLTLNSSNVAVSENYKSCVLTFAQQAFMDFFTGEYSCYESSTGATYNVEFIKVNDTIVKNNNFYDFPLPGQYVSYVFKQDESRSVTIPEDSEWTDNLGNKYLISGNGSYDLQGNFVVDFTMKEAPTESIYLSGKHSFKRK